MHFWNSIFLCLCIEQVFSWVTVPSVPRKLTTLKSAVPEIEKSTKNYYMPSEILPSEFNRAAGSTHRLSRLEMQKAMNDVKRFVESRFENDLHLTRVRMSIIFPNSSFILLLTPPPPLQFINSTALHWSLWWEQGLMMNSTAQNRNLQCDSQYQIKISQEGLKSPRK